jgi:hypothetical protein
MGMMSWCQTRSFHFKRPLRGYAHPLQTVRCDTPLWLFAPDRQARTLQLSHEAHIDIHVVIHATEARSQMSANNQNTVAERKPNHARAKQSCLERGLSQKRLSGKPQLINDFDAD